MIFSCLVLGQPWPTLVPLLLLVHHHSGITSLFIFDHLFFLFPFPRLSLALSLTFLHVLKAPLFCLHCEKHYINIYIKKLKRFSLSWHSVDLSLEVMLMSCRPLPHDLQTSDQPRIISPALIEMGDIQVTRLYNSLTQPGSGCW